MNKNANIVLRANEELKEKVLNICSNSNVSLSSLISVFLEDVATKGSIPQRYLGKITYKERCRQNILEIAQIKKYLDQAISHYGKGDVMKAYLFGSYSRGEAKAKSDIDIRLEIGDKLSLVDISNIRLFLKESLKKDVDLISQDKEKLDKKFLEQIKKEEICLYEHD